MKKPVLSIDEPGPKKTLRADRPPTGGFVTIVDGHFKSEFDDVDSAEAAGRKLKAAYPMLQIEIYDADKKVRLCWANEPNESRAPLEEPPLPSCSASLHLFASNFHGIG